MTNLNMVGEHLGFYHQKTLTNDAWFVYILLIFMGVWLENMNRRKYPQLCTPSEQVKKNTTVIFQKRKDS